VDIFRQIDFLRSINYFDCHKRANDWKQAVWNTPPNWKFLVLGSQKISVTVSLAGHNVLIHCIGADKMFWNHSTAWSFVVLVS